VVEVTRPASELRSYGAKFSSYQNLKVQYACNHNGADVDYGRRIEDEPALLHICSSGPPGHKCTLQVRTELCGYAVS
jgi:hypothetical protein